MHWGARQNKLETPKDKDVNKQGIHECDGRAHDPDTMAAPLTCCANDIFETKTKDGSTAAKAPAPRTNPNTKEATI